MLRHFSGLDDKQSISKILKYPISRKHKSLQEINNQHSFITNKKNHKFTNKNQLVMANVQSYHLQLEQLEELKNYLNQFKMELLGRAMEYQRKVDILFEGGLPIETYNKFQSEHLDVTKTNIQSIVNLIDTHSIPFIIANIELTINQIERNT